MKIDKDVLRSRCKISLKALPEDQDVQMEIQDTETVRFIYEELNRGNEWAWCTAHVTVSYYEMTAVTYLGCCSYASAEAFIAEAESYDDMVEEAIDALAIDLEALVNEHGLWQHDKGACLWCLVS